MEKIFANRGEAGGKLAQSLLRYADQNTVVCALPRGGIEVGLEVAKALKAPLDIIITRKVGHPHNPEYAICTVGENGLRICNEEAKSIDQKWLEEETERQKKEVERRVKNYRRGKERVKFEGKKVILVDDGIATGLTIRAAIREIRQEHPQKIIVAVPVSPKNIITDLRKEADEIITLCEMTDYFSSVGAYYKNFPQVSDEEVVRMLHYRY